MLPRSFLWETRSRDINHTVLSNDPFLSWISKNFLWKVFLEMLETRYGNNFSEYEILRIIKNTMFISITYNKNIQVNLEEWISQSFFRKWRRNTDRKKCCIRTSSSTDTTLETATRSSSTANWTDSRRRRLHLPFVPEEDRDANRAVLKISDNNFGDFLISYCFAMRFVCCWIVTIEKRWFFNVY